MFDFQKEYVESLSKGSRQFVNLPLGIGVDLIIREVARVKGKRLCVIAPRALLSNRLWGKDVMIFSPDTVRKSLPKFGSDDLVYVDVGVSGGQTLRAVGSCLTGEVDFIWRLS